VLQKFCCVAALTPAHDVDFYINNWVASIEGTSFYQKIWTDELFYICQYQCKYKQEHCFVFFFLCHTGHCSCVYLNVTLTRSSAVAETARVMIRSVTAVD